MKTSMQNHLCIENPAGSLKMKYPELQSRNKTLSQELGGMGGSEEYKGERELKKKIIIPTPSSSHSPGNLNWVSACPA